MTRVLSLAALGLLLVCLGFVASPWPWVAPIAPGAFFTALAVVALFRGGRET